MAKRQKLNYNNAELTQNLKASVGQGINALFSPSPAPKDEDNLPREEEPSQEEGRGSEDFPGVSPLPPEEASNNDTVIPRHHDTVTPLYQDTTIETIRKAVKQLGKEAATYRFTLEEKESLVDIVYTSKRTGIRTSENEITRIALNFLMEDYRENKETSILSRVLDRLND